MATTRRGRPPNARSTTRTNMWLMCHERLKAASVDSGVPLSAIVDAAVRHFLGLGDWQRRASRVMAERRTKLGG